ncbi:ATP-binding cassette sub-family B member 10, mitochondrial-like [Portunus trituberculatus]|uniref:ATP-binding cassette sub-family B member 10, mitochondrial-like n=1 Tax=Portunus trituberculatus TaxID=210409 RepID=UPI001E1D0415|nr:ATP-binding cassette sub-family B member 10, mitochondrial-like [Portunus trituberculatus]XP_045123244.1 ATP-binding cassette sub-family B member 10, mitochondrial-like [Portunus trituberculatus]XP_045123245.1 ATP-binding cassette sub-family B member 10, mitochondrial-like [Portunus trituberculatus]
MAGVAVSLATGVWCRGALDPTLLLALRHNWPGTCLRLGGRRGLAGGLWVPDTPRHRDRGFLQPRFICVAECRRGQHGAQPVDTTSLPPATKPGRTAAAATSKLQPPSTSEMRRLFALAKPERWTLAYAIGLLSVSSTITMSVPFALGHVIDLIYTADGGQALSGGLQRVCLALTGVFLTGAAANFGRVYLMNVAGQRITKSLRVSVFSSIMHQETAFFDHTKTGELVNRLSADTALVSQAVTANISDGLRSTVMALAGVGMMFYMSPELAMVGLSIVPPVALSAVFYGRYVKNITRKVQDTLAAATQVAEERIGNVRTVRAFGSEAREVQRYQARAEEVLQMTYRESFARGVFFGLTGLSGNIIILSVLYYGGGLVTDSALTVGQLSSFLLYAAYVGIALGGLSSFYSEMNRGLGASTRLFQLMDRKPGMPMSGGIQLPPESFRGEVNFSGVDFAYPTRPDTAIFKGLNLSVPAGSVVAVVGSSGSGKSTIGSLLLRLYDPQAGEVTVDGMPLTQLDPTWLRSMIGSVSQEPVLFSTTIRENLLYGVAESAAVTEEALLAAVKEANALGFVQSFPAGLDTLVGERGIMLSGGQKQRIAIARALITNPRILLLDEATSALDAESENLVQAALERLMEGRTVIIIAHRLSTIKNASQIAVLDKGVVVELGSYSQLMALPGGMFRKLVERQTITS